jgi:hypothetical protein
VRDATHHQYDRAVLADGVQEDLCDRLARRRSDGSIVILYREEQTEDEEPAEDRGYTDGHDDAYGSRHGRIVCLFRHVRARIEP